MKEKSLRVLLVLSIVIVVIASAITVSADSTSTQYNRYNVVFVVDASGSMRVTDEPGYRFEAIKLFASLLADGGNYLGGVVFNHDIIKVIEPSEMKSLDDKRSVTSEISSITPGGGTNIGYALDEAIDTLLENGNPDLPSVIVFLSDGETDLDDKKLLEDSLEVKADAIQRAREEGIPICSVSLNANDESLTEMEQISSATGGLFIEVNDSEDLKEAFNKFYEFIYGTGINEIPVPDPIPESGEITTDFIVPGLGVEEVNIVIYGQPVETVVTKPNGSVCNTEVDSFGEITSIKIVDADPGKWTIKIVGEPGARVKVNMVFNSDLEVLTDYPDFNVEHYDNEDITIRATLKSGTRVSETAEQLDNFNATLYILDAYGDFISSEPMTVDGGSFVYSSTFKEGTYKFYIGVVGNYLSNTTSPEGPVVVKPAPVTEPDAENTPTPKPIENTAPKPVEETVKETVIIFPFIDNSKTIDLNGLAKDKEDKELNYKIVSTSFMNDDYEFDDKNNKLTITNCRLTKGAFTVRAYDSGGLSCDIEVVVTRYIVLLITAICVGAIALVVLIAVGILLYISLNKRFMGICFVTPFTEDGYGGEKSLRKGRGRVKLQSFRPLGDVGLDLNKCYFQATGKDHVYFVSKKPIYMDRKQCKKIRVDGGLIEVEISADAEATKGVVVKFKSDLRNDLF